MDLFQNGVAALFARINYIDDAALEMSQSSDGLHFDGVHFLEIVVENSRRVDDLVS